MENAKMLILNNKLDKSFKAVLNLKLDSPSLIKFYNLSNNCKSLALGIKQSQNIVKVPLKINENNCEFILPKSVSLQEKLFCAVVDVTNAFCPEIILSGSLNSEVENTKIESAFVTTKPEDRSVLYEDETEEQIDALIDKNLEEDASSVYYDSCSNCKYRQAFYEGGNCCKQHITSSNNPQNTPNDIQNANLDNNSPNNIDKNQAQNNIPNNSFSQSNFNNFNDDNTPQNLIRFNNFSNANIGQNANNFNYQNSQNINNNYSSYNQTNERNSNNKYNINSQNSAQDFNQNSYTNNTLNIPQNYNENNNNNYNLNCVNNAQNISPNSYNMVNGNNQPNNNKNYSVSSQSRETQSFDNIISNGLENNYADDYSEIDNEEPETFYMQIKSQLDSLFNKYPQEDILQQIIVNSKWVRINYDKSENYYVLGLIYNDEYNEVEYISYGMPSLDSINPPEDLKDFAQWLPLQNSAQNMLGYWIVYQDAKTGETVKVNFV